MNRHHKSLEHPVVVKSLVLNKYIVDKSSQARKLVQRNYIDSLCGKCKILFELARQYADGLDTIKRMDAALYDIRTSAYLISYIEDDEIRKRRLENIGNESKVKHRKHYGFDNHALVTIDLLCDDIEKDIHSNGRRPLGNTK